MHKSLDTQWACESLKEGTWFYSCSLIMNPRQKWYSVSSIEKTLWSVAGNGCEKPQNTCCEAVFFSLFIQTFEYFHSIGYKLTFDFWLFTFRSEGLDNVTLDQITEEVGSIALNLKSLRNKVQCSCSRPFQHYSKRVSTDTNTYCTRQSCRGANFSQGASGGQIIA